MTFFARCFVMPCLSRMRFTVATLIPIFAAIAGIISSPVDNLRTHPKIAMSAKMLEEAKRTKESQLFDFSHQRVRILRLLASHPRVRSTTQRLAGNWLSPGIGHGSGGSPLRLRCLI